MPAVRERLTTYERRESIRLLLVRERSTTTIYLMNLFGVTKPTILNDIVFLSSIMPIVTRSGKGGGIFLDMEYYAPRAYLSVDEERLLLEILNSLCEKDKKILICIINKFSKPGARE